MLAERDKVMSEQKTNYMQELDLWIDANVIGPLGCSDPNNQQDWEKTVEQVMKAIRTKVLESYHNGQEAGPRKPSSGFKPRRPYAPRA
jgi:uncharacterized protein YgfB (UPF0149 family)